MKIPQCLKNCSNCDHAFLNKECENCNQNELPNWTNKEAEKLLQEKQK